MLMNIGKSTQKGKLDKTVGVKKPLDRTSSVEEIRNTNMNMKDRWKMMLAAAIGDRRIRTPSSGLSDSASVEIQHEESTKEDSYKQTAINKIALIKLNFIEQIIEEDLKNGFCIMSSSFQITQLLVICDIS